MLENLIAYHCGPALAGIKPANIASCSKIQFPDVYDDIEKINNQLNVKDIYAEIICECDKRALVMVYRKKVLEDHLKKKEMQRFLSEYGYMQDYNLKEYIAFLKTRLSMGEFPHEIGVFLGYPLHDIYGFINHRDEGCLLIGEWKVYDDAEYAKKMFLRYKACRNAIVKRLNNGCSLAQIFCAA